MHHHRYACALPAGLALAALAVPAPAGAAIDRSAGWHGREIRAPYARFADQATPRFPRGWSAGAVDRGTGYDRRRGSERVRELQTRLRRRGYRPGRADGRFGPRTRAAVLWFQVKHGLPAHRTRRRADDRAPARSEPPVAPRHGAGAHGRGRHAGAAGRRRDQLARAAPARARDPRRAGGDRRLALARPAHPRRTERPDRPDRPRRRRRQDRLERPGPARRRSRRGWRSSLARRSTRRCSATSSWRATVTSRSRHARSAPGVRRTAGRSPRSSTTGCPAAAAPASTTPCEEVRMGRAAGIVVNRLRDLTDSVTELGPLLQWFVTADAFVIALDYEIDTSSHSGEVAARALAEASDWAQAGPPRRGAARGAAVADDPRARRPDRGHAQRRHVAAGDRRRPQRRRRPDAARRRPLATLERPGRDRLQTPAGQDTRRRDPATAGRETRPARREARECHA